MPQERVDLGNHGQQSKRGYLRRSLLLGFASWVSRLSVERTMYSAATMHSAQGYLQLAW